MSVCGNNLSCGNNGVAGFAVGFFGQSRINAGCGNGGMNYNSLMRMRNNRRFNVAAVEADFLVLAVSRAGRGNRDVRCAVIVVNELVSKINRSV